MTFGPARPTLSNMAAHHHHEHGGIALAAAAQTALTDAGEQWTDMRIAAAARYDALLDPLGVVRPVHAGGRHVYHLYVVRHADRDSLQAHLTDRGVSTGIHYPTPVHMQPAFADLGYSAGDFPHAEAAASEVLSLPMYPELTAADQQTVASAIAEWMNAR